MLFMIYDSTYTDPKQEEGAFFHKEVNKSSNINYKEIYFRLNFIAVICHIINALGIGIAHAAHCRHIKEGYAFVSHTVPLRWTNHALILVDSTTTKCKDVETSLHFMASSPALNTSNINSTMLSFLPRRDPYPNFMTPFDFTNTDIILYNLKGAELNLNMMLLSFCLLSVLFQSIHGILLYHFEDLPRFMHYLEYAFSSPLMVMVMAVEVGIDELFVVTSIGGLFFGMNIAGMCAEIQMHFIGYIFCRVQQRVSAALVWVIHGAGWALFLMAMIPIWAQFHQVLSCSENGGTPNYVYALMVIVSFLFFVFGFVQVASIMERMKLNTTMVPVQILFKYDCIHAVLSLLAKTLLAWLLLGPMLSVNLSLLKDRVY